MATKIPAKMARPVRLRAVEKAIRDRGWRDDGWVADVAADSGASERTIRRDRDVVLAYLRDEEMGDRETRRIKFLLGLRRDLSGARTDRKWASVATIRNLESRVIGLDVPPPEPTTETAIGIEDADDLSRVLSEIRSMRKDAQARGSLVAAEKLLGREIEVLQEIRLRDEAEAAKNMAHLGEDGLVDMILGSLGSLPETVKARILDALTDGE